MTTLNKRSWLCQPLLVVVLLLNTLFIMTDAFAPPHEDLLLQRNLETGLPIWESVHQYRTRLGIDNFDYETQLLNGEVCRYLSQEQCQQVDESFAQQALRTRSIAQGTHQLKTLIVLVQWPNHENKTLIPASDIDQLWNGDGIDSVLHPTGTIKEYIERSSYGKLETSAHVMEWQMTNGTEQYYAAQRAGLPRTGKEPRLEEAFHYILDQMEANGFPFDEYDQDGDRLIDSIMFLHSGYAADYGNLDCESGASYKNRIWSHALGPRREQDTWTSKSTGVQLGAFAVSSVYRGYCNGNVARLGIMIHEYLHTLGLPDLYDIDGKFGSGATVGGLGAYDIMSNPRGPGNRQAYPGNLSPWSKLDMGWITPVEITTDGTYAARSSAEHADIFMIREGFQDKEYLLIENRQNTGYDRFLWSSGILIYHIDEEIDIHGNNKRGFPGAPGWPSTGRHYPVALLQADGLYELERASNNGNVGDFYRSYLQRLGPGNGELLASDEGIYPNTDSYAVGIRQTGIVIDHFQEIESSVWSFRVTWPKDEEPAGSTTDVCAHDFELDLKTDRYPQETSWELTDSKGRVLISGDNDDDYKPLMSYNVTKCLPESEDFAFTLYDTYGDGLCCGYGHGQWTVWLNGEVIGSGGQFLGQEMFSFNTHATLGPASAFPRPLRGRPSKLHSTGSLLHEP